jgi:hypothetical protein
MTGEQEITLKAVVAYLRALSTPPEKLRRVKKTANRKSKLSDSAACSHAQQKQVLKKFNTLR